MERRTWVASAGAIVLTLVAAATAVAANVGILQGATTPSPSAVVTTGGSGPAGAPDDEPEVVRLTVRDLPPTGTGTAPARPATAPSTTVAPAPAATTAPAPGGGGRRQEREERHGRDDDDD